MMISTKGRYALRVMLDLAEHQPDGYVPLAAIACRQKISEKYLESILSVLSKAGMLDALRGKAAATVWQKRRRITPYMKSFA